jgi:hypothetical protein
MSSTNSPPESETRLIRRLIWLYFWLLIFEGALRKWILPQFSNLLLIIRDPVLLLLYAVALQRGRFPKNGFVITTVVLGVLAFAATLLGLVSKEIQSTLFVTLYGLRANFLHLPLLFLIGEVFTRRDVEILGKWCLLLAPAMAVLVFLQFASSPDAWVNVGAGAGEGGQIGVAVGGVDKIRPPGVFSYNTGLASYVTLVAAFVFYHFIKTRVYAGWLGMAAAGSLAAIAAFSVSRSNVASLLIVAATVLVAALLRPEFIKAALRIVLIALAVGLVASQWSSVREGVSILQSRVEEAEGIQVGLVQRFLNGQSQPFEFAADTPLLGFGLGKGTNAGAGLLTGGDRGFLLSEGEWSRLVLEMGPVIGFAYIILRIGIAMHLMRLAVQRTVEGDVLPLLLAAGCFLPLVQGQFGQPTALGFAVFGGGLCLAAAAKSNNHNGQPTHPLPEDHHAAAASVQRVRGRSVYAETLHGS